MIINILPEFVAEKLGMKPSPMGGWLMSMYEQLSNDFDLDIEIISPGPVSSLTTFNDSNFKYFVIPEKPSVKDWKEYFDNNKVDIIHINGTEMPHSREIFELDLNIPIIVSIQGIISEIEKYVYGNLTHTEILKNITIKDLLKRSSPFSQKKMFQKRSNIERFYLEKSDYIIGRTFWDKAFIKLSGFENKYKYCGENLREIFYTENKWDINNIENYTIFCSQGGIPYKGLHKLLDAIYIVKNQYPQVKVRVSGHNPINNDTLKQKMLLSTYGNFLIKKIRNLKLEKNIEFIGLKNEDEMYKEYLSARIFVQSSFIENSPNSLAEAQSLGVPCIASNVGGTKDFVKNGFNGFTYDSNDSMILANYIIELLQNDELCLKFNDNASLVSKKSYNKKLNSQLMYNIYKDAMNKKEKKLC